MEKMKKNRKGFTIVELVIVIALIAILAAVLIPTFSNVINNAHESNDTIMVKNLNTILNAEEVKGNRADTMQEALEEAREVIASGKAAKQLEAFATLSNTL